MPTLEEMKETWQHLNFQQNFDRLTVSVNGKYVTIPYDQGIEILPINLFRIRVLDPMLFAIEAKIKQENQKCLNT